MLEKFAPLMADPELNKAFKSVEQGAATQVLAAVGKVFEGLGGLYLDDCGVSEFMGDGDVPGVKGYRAWINDLEGEKRLWRDTAAMVGLEGDC